MKLNSKRTILVGLAFLSICAFWQMYDSIVPLILTEGADHIVLMVARVVLAPHNPYEHSPAP